MNIGTLLVCILFIILSAITYASEQHAEWLALLLMIIAGIPHGSFDLRIARTTWGDDTTTQITVALVYLVCVVAMTTLCLAAPLTGLMLFLFISAVHFTEGESRSRKAADRMRAALFGVGAILLPIGFHLPEAGSYINYFVPTRLFDLTKGGIHLCAYLLAGLISVTLLYDLCRHHQAERMNTIERLVCFVSWISLPPLAGFAVWFIGRHSRQHLEICRNMFAPSRFGVPADFAAISIAAIAGLLPFAAYFDLSNINQLFTAAISLIAGLTLPHMIVTHKMQIS